MSDATPFRACPNCGGQRWHRERGPDCMYAVCSRCNVGWDIGWGSRPDYFAADRASEGQ